MDNNHLQLQVANMRKSLFDEGFLDEQFIRLESLRDDESPNFVEEVVTIFYNDNPSWIHKIDEALESRPVNFEKLDNYIHKLKGSCSSIGAKKVNIECIQLRGYCNAGNVEGCIRTFQQVKQELGILKSKLETYFELAKQAGAAD